MTRPHTWIYIFLFPLSVALLLSQMGCGGGTGGTGGGNSNSGPSYALNLSASTISIYPGGSQSITVSVSGTGGFNGAVSVSLGGLPTGVTASPSSFTLNSGSSQSVQLSATATAVAGTSTINLSSSSGTLTRSTQFQLTVTGPGGFTLSVQPSSVSLIPGVMQSVKISVNAVNGFNQLVSGTLSGTPSGVSVSSTTFSVYPGGTATFYFTASSSASGGTVQISASSGTVTASSQFSISINRTPDFQLGTGTNYTMVVSQGASTEIILSATAANGFSEPVNVSFSGIPAGVTFSPATFTLEPGGTNQKITVSASFSAATTGGATIIATGAGGGITHQLQMTLTIVNPSLSLQLQPQTLTVPAGSSNYFELSVANQSVGTPSVPITISISGAPSGITLSPTSYTSPPQGVGFNVFAKASANAYPGQVTVTATYGPVTTTASIQLAIGSANNFPAVPLNAADWLVRTDTTTQFYGFPPPNYTVFHAATQRFFTTEPYLNHLNVTDATTGTLTKTIDIPGAFGLDQAPDGSVLYVGTMTGDVYVVDPVDLTIKERYASSSIGTAGFPANAVYALANGELILEQYFLVPGYSWIDGNGPIALWNPQTNSLKVFDAASGISSGSNSVAATCLSKFENVMLTNGRSRVLLTPVLTSQGSSTLCSLDPIADTWNLSGSISGGTGSALSILATSPDGSVLAAFDGYNIYSLDPATFTVKNTIPIPPGTTGYPPFPVLLVGQDKSSVFLTDPDGADIFDEYNLSTGGLTGWISQLNLPALGSYTPFQPLYQAMNSSGLAAGVIPGGGIGLLNTTKVHAPPRGSRFSSTTLDIPYGPVEGGTLTDWYPNGVGVPPPPLGSIYFGANPATNINNDGFAGYLDGASPAGTAGPVDVRTFATDGATQLVPDGFSYGPWVQESPTEYSTAEGGGEGDLFGYGLGLNLYTPGPPFIAPPSGLNVRVGGTLATVTAYNPNVYKFEYFSFPVLPSKALHYTIPPGTAGTSSSIEVSNDAGSNISTQRMHYLPALQQDPVSGELADGLYDPARDVYYFSDANQIRVFSLTQNAWQNSIPVPPPQGATGPQRLMGMGLSPDGSKLVVADAGTYAVYVIDLNQPSSIQSYPSTWGFGLTEVPTAVAMSNSGMIYIAASDLNGDGGCGGLLELNPFSTTKLVVNIGPAGSGGCLPEDGGFVAVTLASTTDGSRIYFNDSGILGFIDTATDVVTVPPSNLAALGEGGYEIELAASQNRLFADGFLTDANLNVFGFQALNVAESLDAAYVYGGAFSADGSLFFQPGTQAIDVFDGVTGSFRTRVALPVTLSRNFRALVRGNSDNHLIAITGQSGNGIAVIDLSSLPKPTPVSWLSTTTAPVATWHANVGGTTSQRRLRAPTSGTHRIPSRLLQNLSSPRTALRSGRLQGSTTSRTEK